MREEDPDEWVVQPDQNFFSPSLRKIFDSLHHGELRGLTVLADRIERGHATESQLETDKVYEGFCELANQVRDMAHMLRRREETLYKTGARPAAEVVRCLGVTSAVDEVFKRGQPRLPVVVHADYEMTDPDPEHVARPEQLGPALARALARGTTGGFTLVFPSA